MRRQEIIQNSDGTEDKKALQKSAMNKKEKKDRRDDKTQNHP